MVPLRWTAVLATLLLTAQAASERSTTSCGDFDMSSGECGSAEEIGAGLVQLDQKLEGASKKVSPLELSAMNDGGVHFPEVPQYFQNPASPDMSIFPLSWFHIPKCGSSFLNAIVRTPGLCHGLPDDLVIADQTMGPDNILGFYQAYPLSHYCNRGPGLLNIWKGADGGHPGLGNETHFETHWKGRTVTMLRLPEQRMISAFRDKCHSWPLDAEHQPPQTIDAFKDQLQGCAVRMLTRSGISHAVPSLNNAGAVGPHWGGPCGEGAVPTSEEVIEAKKRLNTFLFVGLQEEWELSMCLFHATFGGPCHPSEFINTRHYGKRRPKMEYNETLWGLNGWKDPYDGELYREAEKIFWGRFHTLGLSVEACQPCFDQAHYTYEPSPDI